MLAPYSSDFFVLRELIQNADDAGAQRMQISFTSCRTTGEFGKFSAANNGFDSLPQLSAQSDRHCFLCISTVCSTQHQPRILYQCHQVLQRSVTHLIVSGKPFDSEDWNRLTEVASGNSSSTATGYFGVGFYSVFTMTGRPRVLSDGSVAVLVLSL